MSAFPKRDIARTSGGAAVATSSAQVLTKWDSRQEITIVNNGANKVHLGFITQPGATPVAVVGQGVTLIANGGTWSSTTYTGPIAAIAETSASTISIAEF